MILDKVDASLLFVRILFTHHTPLSPSSSSLTTSTPIGGLVYPVKGHYYSLQCWRLFGLRCRYLLLISSSYVLDRQTPCCDMLILSSCCIIDAVGGKEWAVDRKEVKQLLHIHCSLSWSCMFAIPMSGNGQFFTADESVHPVRAGFWMALSSSTMVYYSTLRTWWPNWLLSVSFILPASSFCG